MLEYFFYKVVKNAIWCVKFLNFFDFLLRQWNQIMQWILITLEPHRFDYLVDTFSIVDRRNLFNMQVFAPFIRLYRSKQSHIEKMIFRFRKWRILIRQYFRDGLQKIDQLVLRLLNQLLQELSINDSQRKPKRFHKQSQLFRHFLLLETYFKSNFQKISLEIRVKTIEILLNIDSETFLLVILSESTNQDVPISEIFKFSKEEMRFNIVLNGIFSALVSKSFIFEHFETILLEFVDLTEGHWSLLQFFLYFLLYCLVVKSVQQKFKVVYFAFTWPVP